MAGPELQNIEVGNELEDKEMSLINNLKLDVFDIDKKPENNMDELKAALKNTKINVITSAKDATTKTTEQKTLSEVATDFDRYVKKWDGWKLQLAEANKATAPQWIKYIVENPKNNDLAFFVQKLAGFIEYKTALEYNATEKYNLAETVKDDKVFGNQTRRALAGLKTWIESDNTTPDKITFLWEKAITKLIKENTKDWKIDKTALNTALNTYHLIFDDNNRVKPIEWYRFIDLNSNNYAVGKWIDSETTNTTKLTLNIIKTDPAKYNLIVNWKDFLPKKEYIRRHNPHKDEYSVIKQDIVNNPAKYNLIFNKKEDFYEAAEWYEFVTLDDPNEYSVRKIETKDVWKDVWKDSWWDDNDIETQLKPYKLVDTELVEIKKVISQKKKDLDYWESGKIYFTINNWKINVYSKTDYTKKIEGIKKQLRLNKIVEIKKTLPVEGNLVKDSENKFWLALPALRGVTFDTKEQRKKFIEGVNALIDNYAYNLSNETPFTLSKKWNISFKPNWSETFFEDNIDRRLKQIEDYKWDSEEYRDEIVTITDYLNTLWCRKLDPKVD